MLSLLRHTCLCSLALMRITNRAAYLDQPLDTRPPSRAMLCALLRAGVWRVSTLRQRLGCFEFLALLKPFGLPLCCHRCSPFVRINSGCLPSLAAALCWNASTSPSKIIPTPPITSGRWRKECTEPYSMVKKTGLDEMPLTTTSTEVRPVGIELGMWTLVWTSCLGLVRSATPELKPAVGA